jgi:hypothetical protein
VSEPRVIQADFAGFRVVQGRKVAQLVLEIPIEASDDALLKLGGIPQPGSSRWCAVALLDIKSSPHSVPVNGEPAEAKLETVPANSEIAGSRRKFDELPLVQQVGIRCSDAMFQEFMKAETEAEAAAAIRKACAVSSRSLILDGSPAGAIWLQMERHYQSWLTDRAFAQVRR